MRSDESKCEKCGSDDILIRYHAIGEPFTYTQQKRWRWPVESDSEYLVRYCRTCTYEWRTPVLPPPPAPSVPPSPTVPYVPRVGDVVRWDGWDKSEFLIQRIEPESPGYCHIHTVRVSGDKKGMEASFGAYGDATFTFVREATEEDKRVAAGLDATVPPSDAPKFKRGDKVRVVRHLSPLRDHADSFRKALPIGCETVIKDACGGDEYVTVHNSWTPHVDELELVAPVSAPTPAATTSEATDPRRVVGAVIAMHDSHPSCYRIVVSGGDTPSLMWLDNESKWSPYFDAASLVFVRWATREECERHGIPYVERGATTSEARPTHVRVKSHPTCSGFTKGKVYEVVEWFGGTPNVMDDTGMEHAMSCCEWEPAPPPVADEADGIDGPYTEAVRLAELMLDPENQPPQYGANEGWRLFSDALSRARSGAGRKDGA